MCTHHIVGLCSGTLPASMFPVPYNGHTSTQKAPSDSLTCCYESDSALSVIRETIWQRQSDLPANIHPFPFIFLYPPRIIPAAVCA